MRSEERAHNERLANDRYREAGRDKHPLRSLRSLLFCILYFSCFIALVSCHYSRPNLEDEHLSKETRDRWPIFLSGIILGIPIWKCWQIL